MKVLQFPLARITIAFIAGIFFTFFVRLDISLVFVFLLVATFIFVCAYYFSRINPNAILFFGIATYFLAFSIGGITQIIHTDSYQQDNYSHIKDIYAKEHLFTVIIREKLKSSSYEERYIAIINAVDQFNCSGRILLNISKDSIQHPFEIGNQLKIKGTLYKNIAPKNPNQFDYQKYLENKQMYAQLHTEPTAIWKSATIKKDIWYYTSKLRTHIIRNLEKSHFHDKELQVAVALIMGQQQDIDRDIIRDYQYAGAVHILSVSGLHVGFILLFVRFFLKPLPNSKRGSFLKLVITLSLLFLFGILAGLAPSVVRSVTMFSFVAVGLFLRRSVNIYHTLLVSILFILLFQPSFLFDVGFQLSYIALFFIIWLQPLLATAWVPKTKIQKYIWDILTVSFAAQIGTLPLSIYYFHQFPGLFFVTNLVVIPFLSFIMGLGALVMIFAAFSWVPFYPAKVLELSIFYLNKVIHTIASFEQLIIKDISSNLILLYSQYVLIIAIVFWLKKPNFKRLGFALLSIILFQMSAIKTKWEILNQQEWIVFNIPKNTLIIERKGENATLFTKDGFLKNSKNNAVVSNYLVGNFSKLKSKKKLKNIFFFGGKKILLVDSTITYFKGIQPDILVLTQSPRINLDRVLQSMKPKIVIVDGSNYKTIQKRWKATCMQQKIPFHATYEKGFYALH